jgi:hypothetical protein
MSKDAATAEKQAALSDDLIWGAQAIADELGIPLQRVYYFIRIGKLPVNKIGTKTIIASRRQLRRFFVPSTS